MSDAAPISRPIFAGFITALVGFTLSFAVVITGLSAVGASPAEAASGLLAVTVMMALGTMVLATRYRMPITIAWSTPGAALLAATGLVEGGWPAAVGAFVVVAALILLSGLWPGLGRLISRIPTSIAQAMLAGVLLPLCLAPITGLVENPAGVIPVLLTWLVFVRLAPRWAVPLAFLAATIVVAVDLVRTGAALDPQLFVPSVTFTVPEFTLGALIGIAIPLFVVTMASQNVPGVAVMRSFGYEIPWRSSMIVTGIGSAIAAPAGGHGINLAALSAALAAAPEADPDPKRRWVAALSTGIVYLLFGAASTAFVAIVVLAPVAVIPAVVGIALLGAMTGAVTQAVAEPAERIPAVVTFLVAASGIAPLGISAAFWSLIAGLVVRAVLLTGKREPQTEPKAKA
jgi:benzoate membrane transport protein